MDEREALTHLRSIVVRGGADGSADLAHACVTALRERGWAGDGELAEALDAVLGSGPTPMLRPLPVDLEEHMEGSSTTWTTRSSLACWPAQSPGAAPSAGSRTRWPNAPT